MKNIIRKSLMVVVVLPMLFLGNQIMDNSFLPIDIEIRNEVPYELIKLKQSIEDYSSKIELIDAEIRNIMYYNRNPYKVLKYAKN